MGFRSTVSVFAGKLAKYSITLLHRGAGATWPGEIALRIDPGIIRKLLTGKTVILVAGTNGKTTTSKMLSTILAGTGAVVRRNETGANLDNGIASILIANTRLGGKPKAGTFVFEVDEASLPIILQSVSPKAVVLLNLFRDQLDRYGEVDTIAGKWKTALARLGKEVQIICNADDPHLVYITKNLKSTVSYFALEDPQYFTQADSHTADSLFCPSCGTKLTFGGTYFSHLGKWACGNCGLYHPEPSVTAKDFDSPLEGVYNIYNTIAAALTAHLLGVGDDAIRKGLSAFTPAFGRQETLVFKGKPVKILLSKNPTGFTESIKTVLSSEKKGPLLLVLNDRIPDGTDVSWIWDVNFELMAEYGYPIVVSGDRAFDLGVRMKHADKSQISKVKGQKGEQPLTSEFDFQVEPDLNTAVSRLIESAKDGQTAWILPTYSAMLEVRKILTGKSIGSQ